MRAARRPSARSSIQEPSTRTAASSLRTQVGLAVRAATRAVGKHQRDNRLEYRRDLLLCDDVDEHNEALTKINCDQSSAVLAKHLAPNADAKPRFFEPNTSNVTPDGLPLNRSSILCWNPGPGRGGDRDAFVGTMTSSHFKSARTMCSTRVAYFNGFNGRAVLFNRNTLGEDMVSEKLCVPCKANYAP